MYHSAPALLTSERSDEFGIDSRGQLSPIVFSVAIFSRFCITELLEVHLRYSDKLKENSSDNRNGNTAKRFVDAGGGEWRGRDERKRKDAACPFLLSTAVVIRKTSK